MNKRDKKATNSSPGKKGGSKTSDSESGSPVRSIRSRAPSGQKEGSAVTRTYSKAKPSASDRTSIRSSARKAWGEDRYGSCCKLHNVNRLLFVSIKFL